MEQTDVVINLVGENLFGDGLLGKRWTDTVKQRLYSSRIANTNKIVEAIGQATSRPKLLVSVSGTDYYIDGGSEVQDESTPGGKDFLAHMCRDWENAALNARDSGVRVAVARQGAVLETESGALRQMLTPFRLFLGASLGRGDQYFSWIHMKDAIRGLLYPVDKESLDGVYNLCSPNPVTMNEFAATLGEVLNRPSLFRVPEFALDLVYGEAVTPVLRSHRVQPKRLQKAGFEFNYASLHEALSEIL
jgi:uncharacterized protein (TIGR01777 family)